MPGDTLRTDSSVYAVAPGLLLKQWDDAQAVVFHPATNSTHLVSASAAQVLTRLLQAQASFGQEALPASLPDPRGNTELTATLAALAQAGLVRQVPASPPA